MEWKVEDEGRILAENQKILQVEEQREPLRSSKDCESRKITNITTSFRSSINKLGTRS